MNIIIYNPNSSGGNYDYAIRLAKAYGQHNSVSKCTLILPSNAKNELDSNYKKILVSDQPAFKHKVYSRLYFIWRAFVNPVIFYFYLLHKKGYVIFNDYDQASSIFWSLLFKTLKYKFLFGVILHDPNRDHYFANINMSVLTMRKVMSIMDVAFFHERLPEKSYYQSTDSIYVSIPHGLYDHSTDLKMDEDLKRSLIRFKSNKILLGALGNVRKEKNYSLIIRSLKHVDSVNLLICGLPANSTIDLMEYRLLAEKEQVSERILIIEKYVNNEELRAIAEICDGFILYYAKTFKSQSGILNLLAPFKKTLLVADNDSPLSDLTKRFNLGLMAEADDQKAFSTMLTEFASTNVRDANWDGYFAYASWENHVNIALDTFSNFKRK